MVPKAKDHPARWYWELPVGKRPHMDPAECAALNEQVELYSRLRFHHGHRFRLIDSYCGIPKGAICTVVAEWPTTLVVWKGVSWWKSHRKHETLMSFELDTYLEFVECSGAKRT